MKVEEVLRIFVAGTPVPQGSKKAFVRGGHAQIVDDNKEILKPWRAKVSAAAQMLYKGERLEGPVAVELEFRFERPKTVTRDFPSVKPDGDKLERAIFDAMTAAGVWRDDARVVACTWTKVYAEKQGVIIRVGVPA